MKLSLEKQIPLVFSIATILLIIVIFFAWRSMKSVNDSLELQSHTQEVLLQLDEILITTLDIETSGRAFLIGANPNFLESYNQSQSKIEQNINNLRQFVEDNTNQKNRIPNLENAINERLEVLRSAVELRRTNSLEEVLKKNITGRGREKMNTVRALIDEMETEERNLLAKRTSELVTNRNTTYGLIIFAGIAGILSLGLANFAIFREIKKRRSAEDDLREANKDLEKRVEERTQEISQKNDELKEQIKQREYTENRHRLALDAGSLGTWMVNPHTNKSEIDERGLSLFGFSAEDFDGNAFGRVYEEDAPKISELFHKSISKNEFFNAEFRVLTADGKIRWNNCVGQPVLDENGKVAHIVGNCRDVTEIKENENLIRQSELFRRAIIDSLSAHIAVIDKTGEIVAVNSAWEKFAETNCVQEKIATTGIGQNYLKVCENGGAFDDETKEIIKNLRAVLDGKSDGFAFEYPCHAPTEERWFLLQVTSLKSEKGGAVVSHIDISDRKKAEAELKNSEEFSRSVFENSPDCVKILELDGTLHSMNKNGLCIMEIDDFNEFVGKQWIDFWKDDENEMAYQAVKSAREGKATNFQGFCETAKGTGKWWDVSVAPIFDATGKPIRLISTSRDITGRREAEKSRFHLAAIVESSNDAVISKDLNGNITSWNKGAENLFGYKAEDVVGKSITILIPPDYLDEEPKILERIRQGEKVVLYETTRMRKDKSRVEVSLTISPIFDYSGKIIGASKIARDVTERKQAEAERETLLINEQAARKEAEIANRLRDEFLATVSHELRAPLNSILGWGKLLIKGNLDNTTSDKAIQTIVRNAEAQNRLIEDLLDVSRIISGKLRLEVITVKPIIFVEAAMETVRPAAEAKNITLEVHQDAVISHISGDPNRLQQVVWNLLSNAIKFTPVGGKVTVEIERMNGHAEIRVKDTGAGISQEFLPHVFDRFRQADASSIRKFGGLGLGLAIVRHIVEMHGGTVSAISAGENLGSTFTVSLPVTSAPKDEEENEENSRSVIDNGPKLSLDGLLILVVDDEEDTRQLLVQSLTFYGATVITAKSVEEGLSALQEKNPDVLVSDIGMPDEDGYTFIKKIRALENEHHKNIIAVALTAFTRAQDRMRALASGYQNHVGKPVELDELATVIASLTGRLKAD